MREQMSSDLTKAAIMQTDVATAKPEFQFLIDLGYTLQQSPKSLRYFKHVNSTLREVVLRAQAVERFMIEVAQVKKSGPNRVKSRAITSSLAECVLFARTLHA
jgi:hypothetical protein